MPLTQPDPFTQIHYAIWRVLIAYPPWAEFVPQGCRINSIPSNIPSIGVTGISHLPTFVKVGVDPGDRPEVRISQKMYGRDQKNDNSMIRAYKQDYLLQMSTTDPNLSIVPQNYLKYLTEIALFKANFSLGLPELVRKMDYADGADMPVETEDETKSWVTTFVINVQFYLNKSFLNSL